jgi:hypothetical protein
MQEERENRLKSLREKIIHKLLEVNLSFQFLFSFSLNILKRIKHNNKMQMKIEHLSRDAARGMRIQHHSLDVNLFITQQYIISILIIPLINLLLTKENTTTQ